MVITFELTNYNSVSSKQWLASTIYIDEITENGTRSEQIKSTIKLEKEKYINKKEIFTPTVVKTKDWKQKNYEQFPLRNRLEQ